MNESWSKNEKHFNVFWGQKHFSSFQITGDEFLNLPCTEVCLVYLNTVCIWGSNTSLTASHGWLLQDQGRFQGIDWDGCLFLLQKSYLYLVILWTACKSFWIFFFCCPSLWAIPLAKRRQSRTKAHDPMSAGPAIGMLRPAYIFFRWEVLFDSSVMGSLLGQHPSSVDIREKRKYLWTDNRCPFGFLPRDRQWHHNSYVT